MRIAPEVETARSAHAPRLGPRPPPRIATSRRLARMAFRIWPLTAWCGAAIAAAWLYFGGSGESHAIACESAAELRIAPSVASRLLTIDVAVGQVVQAGDPIATLDPGDIDARLRLAHSELDRARSNIEAERATLRITAIESRAQALARRTTFESEGLRLRAAAAAQATDQATDQAELAAIAPQIERQKALLDRQLTTVDRVEELERRRALLAERIVSRGPSVERVQAAVVAWDALTPESSQELDLEASLLPLELARASQEARVAQLELERQSCRIAAPASGTISRILVRPGEWCVAGAEIACIVLPSAGAVSAYIVDRQIQAVKVGTLATLRPRDLPGRAVEGRVTSMGPLIEEVPLRLRPTLDSPQWGRRITLELQGQVDSIVGAIYDVRFH